MDIVQWTQQYIPPGSGMICSKHVCNSQGEAFGMSRQIWSQTVHRNGNVLDWQSRFQHDTIIQ
jgi:hypothetical protein